MSTSETIRVSFGSSRRPTELTVRDYRLRSVYDGVTPIVLDLPAGVYEVEMRTGAAFEQSLISARDIAGYDASDLGLGIDTPIPVSGAARRDYRAGEAATVLSSELLASGGISGLALLLMHDADAPDSSRQGQISLLNPELSPIGTFAELTADPRGAWSGAAAVLDEGGYLLRHTNPGQDELDTGVDVPLWVCAGFQTLVFVPCRPEPRLDLMSVHMTPADQLWTGFDDSANALELALRGLRGGRLLISQQNLHDIASLVTRNPMLGLVTSYAIAGRPGHEPLRRELLNLLEDLIPGHPDVFALSAAPASLRWPPSVSAGYLMTLRAEAERSITIAPGTLAEAASRDLLLYGPWTAWRSTSTVASESSAPAAVRQLVPLNIAAALISAPVLTISPVDALARLAATWIRMRQKLRTLLAAFALRDWSSKQLAQVLADLEVSDGATDRVRYYLASIVSLGGQQAVRSLRRALLGSSRPVALATSLPLTLARSAMADIARALIVATRSPSAGSSIPAPPPRTRDDL